MSRLAGKVALVTGSTMGVGEAIARRFAAEGARVMVHGLEAALGEQVVSEIVAAGGDASLTIADIAEAPLCGALVEAVVEKFGRIDIVVNNAANTARSNLDTTDEATFDAIVAVNLRAPLLLTRAAVPYFRRQGGGVVLNIGSINAYGGERNLLAYSISKGGLATMTRNLADGLGPEKIRVNQFNLGWVLTPHEYSIKRAEGFPEDWPERVPPELAPSGRLMTTDEVAHHALSFVEDAGGFVSGSVVDLGQYPFVGRNPSPFVLGA